MRFSFLTSPITGADEQAGSLAQLCVKLGQSENFEALAETLKAGLEAVGLQGCFLVSCFGFNRESRFGGWSNRYVFPLRSDLTEVKPTLTLRDDLIIVSSGYFTLVVGEADTACSRIEYLPDSLLMLGEATRLWVKHYTDQVDQEFDSLNHRKASSRQLLEVVNRLDESGQSLQQTHNRVIRELNAGIPKAIDDLDLDPDVLNAVMDEFDEVARAYTIFTKQQMELNRELKEQVRSIAGFLLARGADQG